MSEPKVQTAKEYIQQNTVFYTDENYAWLRSTISMILEDAISDKDVIETVDRIVPPASKKNGHSASSEISAVIKGVDKTPAINRIKISRIKSIAEIHNIGIVDIENPIKLSEKNKPIVFYGRNGSGKSSFYLGLCKALGRNDKKILRNIRKQDEPLKCVVKIIDGNHRVGELIYDENENFGKITDVMIFDNEISTSIVRQPQTNNFKIARLQIEYFTKIDSIINELKLKLSSRETAYIERRIALLELMGKDILEILENDRSVTKKRIAKVHFTQSDKGKLKKAQDEVIKIGKSNNDFLMDRINGTVNLLLRYYGIMGTFSESFETQQGRRVYENEYSIQYFKDIVEAIKDYFTALKFVKENKIGKFISRDWIALPQWQEFITKSIEFIAHLEKHQQKEFKCDKCPYCLQPLENDDAKSLLQAYYEMQNTTENNLQEAKNTLNNYQEHWELIKAALEEVDLSSSELSKDFKLIGIEVVPDFNSLLFHIENLINAIKRKKVGDTSSLIQEIASYLNFLKNTISKLEQKIKKLKVSEKNKDKRLDELQQQIQNLTLKQDVFSQKKNILELFEVERVLKIIENYKGKCTTAKAQLSSAKTRFEKDSNLQTFEEYVKKEYRFFYFEPPEEWNISAQTSGSVTERVYSLGEKALRDIFSEGEQKLHALSDFFAFAEITKYKGVFIFDDPVTSLDQDNIERVADRIKLLIEAGNQVIVFTHNLLFLNYLVDTKTDPIYILNKYGNEIVVSNEALITKHKLKQTWHEIKLKLDKLKKTDVKSITEFDIKCVYDRIRGYLEDYFEDKAMEGVMQRYHPLISMTNISKLGDLPRDRLEKLSQMHFKMNRKISSHSQVVGSPTPRLEELNDILAEIGAEFGPKTDL